MLTLDVLRRRFAGVGAVMWIGVRPAVGAPTVSLPRVRVEARGLEGDRHRKVDGPRAVTLVQWEHLATVATLLGLSAVDPALLRRNLVVSGINLQALKRSQFRVGETILEGTGDCHPCSHMEEALGFGGYTALQGHGGITARVLTAGCIAVGDAVAMTHAISVSDGAGVSPRLSGSASATVARGS